MPDENNQCTPLSLQVGLKRNATQKIEFGLTKSCKKVGERVEAAWTIHFALLVKDGDKFEPKVSIDININNEAPGKEKQAEETTKSGISGDQTFYLLGPVARAADKVVAEQGHEEVVKFFGDLDRNSFKEAEAEANDDATFEFLDRVAATRSDNMRKLRTRVISVLDVG